MTHPSDYFITVDAPTGKDAQDIAKRRANDDGWRVLTVRKVKPSILEDGRYVVELAVTRQ